MPSEGFERKLAATLTADLQGYSRLMSEDEAATVRALLASRALIRHQIIVGHPPMASKILGVRAGVYRAYRHDESHAISGGYVAATP